MYKHIVCSYNLPCYSADRLLILLSMTGDTSFLLTKSIKKVSLVISPTSVLRAILFTLIYAILQMYSFKCIIFHLEFHQGQQVDIMLLIILFFIYFHSLKRKNELWQRAVFILSSAAMQAISVQACEPRVLQAHTTNS